MRLGRSRFAKIVVFLTNLSTIVAINLNPKGFEPPPKLTASIRCVDGRTILLTITNHNNSLPVNIIKWNSILEDFPVTRVPFTVRTIQEARDLDRAPSAHVTYVDVLDSHFIQIGPLNPYTHEIHVPSWYAIPATGKYRVRWNGSLRGFLGDFGGKPASHDNLRLKRSDIYTLPRMPVFIEADVFLDRSIMPLQVQETRECKGWGLVEKPVENARNGAIDLAKATEINVARNRKFWKRYFNGNDAIGNDVSRVFGNIENYFTPRGGNGFTLVERCAPNERPPCGPGAASYTVIEEKTKIRTTIVFCAGFHEDEKATPPIVPIVQPIRPCEFPGPGPIFDPDMMDQTGIYLNAFLRSGISGEDIFDGTYYAKIG